MKVLLTAWHRSPLPYEVQQAQMSLQELIDHVMATSYYTEAVSPAPAVVEVERLETWVQPSGTTSWIERDGVVRYHATKGW